MWGLATANRLATTLTGSTFSVSTNGNSSARKGHGMLLSIAGNFSPDTPTSLKTEGVVNPVNMISPTPDFTAIYEDQNDGDLAEYYQLTVSTSTDFTAPLWDTGKTAVAATTTEGVEINPITYAGPGLVHGVQYYWRIKFWDDNKAEGEWSDTAEFLYALGIQSDIIQDINYTYDAVGNITHLDDNSGTQAAKVVNYSYDDLYRLTSASTTAASTTPSTHSYAYTSIGNISSSTPSGSYTYGETGYANPHAPTSINGTTLAYDNNGNVTSYGSDSYAWDYRNRMVESSNGAASTTYGYDHSNTRVRKEGAETTVYPNNLFDVTGSTTTKHIFANGEVIATVEDDGVTNTMQFVHADHLGGVNDVTDDQGYVVETLDYYPYGSERVSAGDAATERNYIGQEYDEESDLSYLQARYYSGNRGQFLSQDPVFWEVGQTDDGKRVLMDPQLQNSYSYARNNPIVNKDPDGRIIPLVLAAYGIASVGINAYDYALTNTNLTIPGTNYRIGYKDQFSAMEQQVSQNQILYDALSFGANSKLNAAESLLLGSLEASLDTLEKLTGKNYSDAIFRRDTDKKGNVKVEGASSKDSKSSSSRNSGSSSSSLSPATVKNLQSQLNSIQKELNQLQKQQSSKKK